METIGIIANFDKKTAPQAIGEVCQLACDLGFKVYIEPAAAKVLKSENIAPAADFALHGVQAVVVLGGDGTMLDAAHRIAPQNLPLMGLNIGSLGYLTSVEEHQFEIALRQLRTNRYEISLRSALTAVLHYADGRAAFTLPDALNDVVVSRGGTGRAVKIALMVDRKLVTEVLCDGIIIATPTGSTAYSLSAGGPILLPDTPAIVISMICPHTLTSRPLVMRDNVEISLCVKECQLPMLVNADGRVELTLEVGDTVTIKRSARTIPLIELHGYNPYEVLGRKLRWGGR